MSGGTKTFVPVQIGTVWLALDAAWVREVLGERPWVPLPGASPALPGVIAWRGRAIAVVDIGALTGLANPLHPGRVRHRVVVAQFDPYTLALPVEAVREVMEVPEEEFRPPHATMQTYSAGEIDLLGVPTPVLDLPAVIRAIAPATAEGS